LTPTKRRSCSTGDNLDAIRGLAENLLNNGQTDAALEQYKVIADANPEDAQTYLRIAEIYRRRESTTRRSRTFKKADTMVPDSMEVPYNIAAVYQAQGRLDEAVKLLQDLLKKPKRPIPVAARLTATIGPSSSSVWEWSIANRRIISGG